MLYTHMHTHASIYMHVYTYIYRNVHMCISLIHICTYVHISIRMNACTYRWAHSD